MSRRHNQPNLAAAAHAVANLAFDDATLRQLARIFGTTRGGVAEHLRKCAAVATQSAPAFDNVNAMRRRDLASIDLLIARWFSNGGKKVTKLLRLRTQFAELTSNQN